MAAEPNIVFVAIPPCLIRDDEVCVVEKVSKLENEGKVIRRDPDFRAIARFTLKYKSQTFED